MFGCARCTLLVRWCVILTIALLGVVMSARLGHAAQNNFVHIMAHQVLRLDTSQDVCPRLIFARDALNQAARHPPTAPPLSPNILGLYAYAAGDVVNARRAFSQQAEPTAVDLFWLGCAAYRAGDDAAARKAWQAARAEAYFIQNGRQAYLQKDVARATALYEIALGLAPDSAEAWDNFAQMQFERAAGGRLAWADVLAVSEKALRLSPDDAMAHYRLGYGLWVSRADWTRAESELRWAWAHDNNWLIAYSLGSLLVDEGKRGEAVDLLAYAFSQADTPWTRFNLMRAYALEEHCAEAESIKTQMLLKYPAMVNPLRALCRNVASCICNLNP
jgi:tetratricopeptide (TPR) repeat protein